MSDQPNPTTPETQTEAVAPLPRVFKIGSNRIVEGPETTKLSNEQVRKLLAAQYPEVANATIRETINGEARIVEYLPQPGRKG